MTRVITVLTEIVNTDAVTHSINSSGWVVNAMVVV